MNGSHPIFAYKHVLKPNGHFIHVGGSESQMFQALLLGTLISRTGSKKISNLLQRANQQDLNILKELIEAGKVKPVIDRFYTLREVREAFRYFQEGHAQGKVVITV